MVMPKNGSQLAQNIEPEFKDLQLNTKPISSNAQYNITMNNLSKR